MGRTIATGLAATFWLCGCATASFAPPSVSMDRALTFSREQSSFNAVCTPNFSTDKIGQDVDGARRLINNYILTYRCQAHRAAEGRQFFEVPGFLLAAGAATAAAFGAPAGIAIGAGAGGAVLSHGNSYYAPQQKAAVFSHALDAFICIKTAAVGLDSFTLDAISSVQQASTNAAGAPSAGADTKAASLAIVGGTDATPGADAGPTVTISAGAQYFDLVQAALFSVQLITAQRLAAAGTPFDSAGVVAEIEALKEKAQPSAQQTSDAQSAAATLLSASNQLANAPAGTLSLVQTRQASDADQKLRNVSVENLSDTILQLKLLQPKLEQCVVRAKI
jgi:hypothetical protein